jgi:hypothetical protein
LSDFCASISHITNSLLIVGREPEWRLKPRQEGCLGLL